MSGHLHKPSKVKGNLELHYLDGIAIIVMNDGENRINPTYVNHLNALLDDIERDSSIKGLITTGAGKFYSNGLDLKWMAGHRQEIAKFLADLTTLVLRILVFPIPTLAAMNGHAFAGGALLAYAHDLRVQNESKGWLCLNEVFISLRFHPAGLAFIRTKVGGGRHYTDAVVLGKRYTGPEALQSGLVHLVSPLPLLLPESVRLIKSFGNKSALPRESLHNMKSDVFQDAMDLYRNAKVDSSATFGAKL